MVAVRQLTLIGISRALIARWSDRGDLHAVHRGVDAVGHTALSTEGRLSAAVLYAGPAAMLSHAMGLWWLELTHRRPLLIQVSTPRRCAPAAGLEIHDRRPIERVWHRGRPVAPLPRMLLD